MGSTLQIRYKGTMYPDMSFIDLKDREVVNDETYSFELVNKPDDKGNNYDTRKIRFATNMNKRLYKIDHPKEIPMGQEGPVILTIFLEQLFNDTSMDIYDKNEQRHFLQMQFDYEKVRTFR